VPDYFTSAAGTFRILSDHLGSPRLIVNTTTGATIEEIDYDEFGNVTNDTSPGLTPFGFAGGLYDKDTGLVRFGRRDYDPSVGRWTTKDPRGIRRKSFNVYSYAMNDPVNRRDPFGADSCGVVGTVVCTSVCAGTAVLEGPAGLAGGALCSFVCGLIFVEICDPGPKPDPGPAPVSPPPGPTCPNPPPCNPSIATCP
jgi:RHS repeat-associated protein